MSHEQCELAAAALVREYLSRKGYKQALAELDAARPRSESDLSSRSELIKELRLERLVKRNRERRKPLSTMLEVVAEHLLLRERGLRGVSDKKVDDENAFEKVVPLPAGGPLAATAEVPSARRGSEKNGDLGFRPTCSELCSRQRRSDR